MAVVSHLLKLADGRKWQSRASRWLSLTCHLNGLIRNQINVWLQTMHSMGAIFRLCPRMGDFRMKESGTIEAISKSTLMAWYGQSQLPTWAEFLISYGERVGGLESWAGPGGDINEMYPNQLCVAPQPRRRLIMWCPCLATDDYGLKLNIFIS